jgi:hypothetical protein
MSGDMTLVSGHATEFLSAILFTEAGNHVPGISFRSGGRVHDQPLENNL